MPNTRTGVVCALKVCEGCGSLWLRREGDGIYCRGCARFLGNMAGPRTSRRCRKQRERMSAQVAVLPLVHAVAQEVARPDPFYWAEVPMPATVPRAAPEDVSFYRKYTEAMCRRYVRLSMETGRSPALLGRELFRGNVSHCMMTDFSDVSVFCMDMQKLIERIPQPDRDLVARIALQEYSQVEAASMLRMCLRTATRKYWRGIDTLTTMLLDARMLEPMVDCAQ